MSKTYELTVPPIQRALAILSTYLDRAETYATAHDLVPADVMAARLTPDMLPLAAQIQRASDKSKNGVARLAGIISPSFDDTERSFAELKQRLDKTIAFIASLTPAQFHGAEDRTVELRFRSVSGKMTGAVYRAQVLMPDIYFHVAIAHGILRQLGVPVGKADYLGEPDYLGGSFRG